ncbi:MAG: M28 family peptidase [Gemmatimonadota bacterium]
MAGLLTVLTAPAGRAQDVPAERISGFTAPASAAQRELEERFLVVPSADSAARTVAWLSRGPHLAGTPALRALADSLAGLLEGLGFDVALERYDVYLPQPRALRLTLVRPQRLELGPRELLPGRDGGVPDAPTPWDAYSASGVVEAPVVYANYGLADDYAALARAGVDPRGRIVLARHGRAYRGVKVLLAEERGAVGLVLYSDPADGGHADGDTVPEGPYRPGGAVQRGTVAYLWRYTGDPLTPGRPALPGVPRLSPAEAADLPRIPVLPVGYADAEPVLRRLRGTAAPAGFQGALPFRYHLGPGPAAVRLEVELDGQTRPVWNVVGRLPGRERQRVLLGNHYDAWVYGAADPHSGTSALLELARGLAALRRSGWSPRHEIVLAFWDAEEFGAVGSTEWVEDHLAELQREAVAYFNVDMLTAGGLDVSGSPALEELVRGAAAEVADPITGRPLGERWAQVRREPPPGCPATGLDVGEGALGPLLGDLGAGSDWTAFFHHAGVPSLQWTMNGRGVYEVWHSALDDLPYAASHADSAFLHAPALARVMGVAALRLAEADALPFRYVAYADRIGALVDSLASRHESEGAARLPLEVGPLRRAVQELRSAARELDDSVEEALARSDDAFLRRANERLPAVEQAFLDGAGAPGRPWYRHAIWAADERTGYGALPLPGLAAALAGDDRARLAAELARLHAVLGRATHALRDAAGPDDSSREVE